MKVIGVIVMWAMVAALVLCAALWPLARHADRRGAPGLLHVAITRLRRLTLPTLLALSAVFTISVAHSGKNTNSVQNVDGQFLMQFTLPQAVTPQDFSNGWRVVEETGANFIITRDQSLPMVILACRNWGMKRYAALMGRLPWMVTPTMV